LIVALGVAAVPLVVPRGEPPLPRPGSAHTIASLVTASSRIEHLPNDLTPDLYEAINDDTGAYFPSTEHGCGGVNTCVFGDRSSKTTIVLFGDSHAYMWLPAFVNFAARDKLRIVLIWLAACPTAKVTVWNQQTNVLYTSCNTFRERSIAAINALAPALVLLASRTTEVEGPNRRPIPQATWQTGMEVTIRALATHTTKVAVLGDIAQFSVLLPDCLSAEPNNVQNCSTKDPNPKIPGHFAADQLAARATHAAYVNPQPWLCRSTCSPIIGNMVAYYNNDHVSATYAAFLGAVFAAAVVPLLGR
jgi:hypothetical protein